MTTPFLTTPAPALEDRVTILETRLDAVLPTLATKADIAELKTDMARLEGRMEAMHERQEGRINRLEEKMEAMHNRLLLQFGGIVFTAAALAVAAAKFLL